MQDKSSGKHSLLDPEPSSSLTKKPRISIDKHPKSPRDTVETLRIQLQENIHILENCIEQKLKPELDGLGESWENLEIQYKKLQSFFTAEKMPIKFNDKYRKRMKRVSQLNKEVSNEIKEAKELQKPIVLTKRTVNKVLSPITTINKLVENIQKEKGFIESAKETFIHKIGTQQEICKKKVKRLTVKGDEFQRILQVLLRQRALSCPGAEVGIEVSGVGQLDDAVYSKTTENKCRFFQVKHTTKRISPVTGAELFKCNFENDSADNDNDDGNATSSLNTSQGEGKNKSKEQAGLHLLMYFKSFCNIKESSKFENCIIDEVTLITNRDIELPKRKKDHELVSLLVDKRNDFEKDECLDFENRRAQKYGLKVKEVRNRYFSILKRESHKYLSKKINNAETIIDEFLEKVHIVVNYPDLHDLRRRTFNEVFHEDIFCSLNRKILENCMLYTEIKLLQESNEFTTNVEWESEINEIKKFINVLKSVSLTDLKKQCLLSEIGFSITFENVNDIYEDVKNLMKENGHQVLECTGSNFKMNIIKIIHILQERSFDKLKFLFCEYDNLLTADFLLKAFFDDHFDLLVVMCKNIPNNEEVLWTNLGNALNKSKRMIIVSEGKNTFTSSMKDLLKDKYLCKQYQHGYKHLTQSCKEKLRNKQIIFQMQEITFGKLISDNLANNIVDDNCLCNIVGNSNPEIKVSDNSSFCSLGYSEEYYISRVFYQKTISFNKLQKKLSTNVFFVTGTNEMSENEIRTVFETKQITVQKWNDQTEYKNGIVLGYHTTSSNDHIFNTISSSTNHVHWISMNEHNKLFLIDSTEEHIANELIAEDQPLKKEKYLDINDLGRIVVLVGDSGVGKSTTLTSIANKIRQTCSTTWVARVILRKCFLLRTLENTNNFISPDDAITCVCKMIFTSEPKNLFDTNLINEGLKCSYKSAFRFVLLLDGFNEINETLQEKLIILIKTLRDHCNVDQIWITTQNHDRVKLETELRVSSHFLKPLTDEDQINLMAQYWQTENKKKNPTVKTNYDELYGEARIAIQQFKSSVNDVEKRLFTENSLNLKMLADVLLCKEHKLNEKPKIFDLYEIFVQHKFSVHRRETALDHLDLVNQGEIRPICTDSTKDKLFENFVRGILQQFSVKTILSNHRSYLRSIDKLPGMDVYETFKTYVGTSECELALSKLGLLVLKNHDFDFIHPSFSQFFFSEYLIKSIIQLSFQSMNKFWVQSVLSTDSFQPCRRFLDRALGRLEESNPKVLEKVTNNLASSFSKILIQKTRNSAAPIKENLYYVSLFLLRWLKKEDREKYLNKILNQDFKFNSDILLHTDKIITYFHIIPIEQSVKKLILLYQNMYKTDTTLSFVHEVIKLVEHSDQETDNSSSWEKKPDC